MDELINKDIKQLSYQETIVNQLPTDRFVYLLIDGAQTQALQLIYTQNQQPEFEVLYHTTPFQDMLDMSPVIVRLDNNIQLQNNYEKWQPYAVAFTSTVDLKTTADHLRSLILCKMPNTQPAFFRFYGHNWLYPLLTGQDESTLYSFTGPIDIWYIPLPDKQWQGISIVQQGECKEANQEAWFTLTEELQAKLADYTYQQFIDTLTTRYTDLSLATPEGQIVRTQVLDYVEQAKSYGLKQRHHLTKYTDLAFCYPHNLLDKQAFHILSNEYEGGNIKLEQLTEYLRNSKPVNEPSDNYQQAASAQNLSTHNTN